jgi:hypothetical protein
VTAFRLLRILGIAAAFFVAFNASQAATAARNAGETTPGIGIAIAVLSVFFLIGALANEATQGPEMNGRKDLLWGLSSGGFAITLARLVA